MHGKAAVFASVAAHGAALALVARWLMREDVVAARTLAVAPRAAAVAPRGEAIEVEFVTLGPGSSDARPSGGSAIVASTHGGHRGAPAGGEVGAPRGSDGAAAGGSRYFHMRGPDLALGDAFVSRFLDATDVPDPVRHSKRVAPAGGGTARIYDRVTTVSIARDGTAHFRDKADVDASLDLPLPTPERIKATARDIGKGLADWYVDPYRDQRAARVQELPRHLTATPGACDHFTDACSTELRDAERNDATPPSGAPIPIAHGKLDLTGWLMRHTVGDPYASRKLRLLDDTRAERAEMGERDARAQLARADELMQRNLQALWRSTPDATARRAALFAMWDECAEGSGPLGEAGERARRLVVGWIRAKLPAGAPDAFTADEVARANAHRTSVQRFAPYE